MESTKSQLVLRSMDMDGRSLGTERSSAFPGGTSNSQPNALAPEGQPGGGFAAVLADSAKGGAQATPQQSLLTLVGEGLTPAPIAAQPFGGAQAGAQASAQAGAQADVQADAFHPLVFHPTDLEGPALGTELPASFTSITPDHQANAQSLLGLEGEIEKPAVLTDPVLQGPGMPLSDDLTVPGLESSVPEGELHQDTGSTQEAPDAQTPIVTIPDVPSPVIEETDLPASLLPGSDTLSPDLSAPVEGGLVDAPAAAQKPSDPSAAELTDEVALLAAATETASAPVDATDAAGDGALETVGAQLNASLTKPDVDESEATSSSESETPELEASEAQGLAGTNGVLPAAAGPFGFDLLQGPLGESSTAQNYSTLASLQGILSQAGGAAAPREDVEHPAAHAVQAPSATEALKVAQEAEAPRSSERPLDTRALLKEMRIHIQKGDTEARIQLRPAQLGRLDLLIRVEGNHVVAQVAAESVEALAALENHSRELRAWFAQDGAESVELKFTLIERGDMEFAHRGDDGQGSSFQDKAERRSFEFAGQSEESSSAADSPSSSQNAASERSIQDDGVDFIA